MPEIPPPPAPPVVEFREVSKEYPGAGWRSEPILAADGVSFAVSPGEVVGLIGPNRAGKTTLVKLLLSLCQPSGGRVLRFGRDSDDLSTLGRVGYIHENPAFPRYLSATKLLDYYGTLSGVPRAERRARIPGLLAKVGLKDRDREPISRFSKGMVQRLGIAQALLNQPDLLVLDEPGEGLDLQGRRLIRDLLDDQREAGRTVLLVSHQLAEVEQFCDRVVVILGGKVFHDGPIEDLPRGSGKTVESALCELYEGVAG